MTCTKATHISSRRGAKCKKLRTSAPSEGRGSAVEVVPWKSKAIRMAVEWMMSQGCCTIVMMQCNSDVLLINLVTVRVA